MAERNMRTDIDRRSFLAASAAGAIAVASSSSVLASTPKASASLRVGATVGDGWEIEEICELEAGAVRVVVGHTSGRKANVSICKREEGSGALARTEQLDFFLMNDGKDGSVLTPDDEVGMAQRLSKHLAGTDVQGLLGREERLRVFDPIDHLEPFARHQ